jgi:CRISPR-associated protein Csd1
MIQALLDFADAVSLATPAAFERRPVHYFLELDLRGNLIGISPTCRTTEKGEARLGKEFTCPAFFPLVLKNGEVKANGGGGISVAELAAGDTMEVFRTRIVHPKGGEPSFEHLIPAANGSETEPEGSTEDADEEEAGSKKNQYYRHLNWKTLHKRLFKELRASGTLTQHHWAVWRFIVRVKHLDCPAYLGLLTLPDPASASGATTEEAEKQQKRLKQQRNRILKDLGAARFAFRVAGRIMLSDSATVRWWKSEYARQRAEVAVKLPAGDDGYRPARIELIEATNRLTPVFPIIRGIPKSGTWCPFASFDKAPFKSYGLGKMTAPLRVETAERVAGALNYLLKHPHHHFKLGNIVAVFWAVRPLGALEEFDIADLLDSEKNPDPLEVFDFLKNLHGHAAAPPQKARFYCAMISSPKSRITVRSWHTATLGRVEARSRSYFETVSLPSQWGERKISSLNELAEATISDSSKGGPPNSTYAALLNAAFFGPEAPLPHQLFAQVVRRQVMELASGFTEKTRNAFEARLRHRAALIQLHFALKHKTPPMTTDTFMNSKETAILCGRLLAILDKIHNEAHDNKSASSPANRLYGAASATPALVFPKLCQLARHHLQKIGGGWAYNLEFGVPQEKRKDEVPQDFEGLAAIVARLKEAAHGDFPRILSLEDQGRFALGFYYERERCRQWPGSKSDKPENSKS